MIDIYHADEPTLSAISSAENERQTIGFVLARLSNYAKATTVKHGELDIAFAATGGPSQWCNADCIDIEFSPVPDRTSHFGDILVERATGYVNLSTPAGFIPLVDVIEKEGQLQKIVYS